jgi:hypothetical protein
MAGEQVDDGSFSIATDRSIVLPADPSEPGTPDVTLVYEVSGTSVTFTVKTQQPCSSQPCVDQVAWAKETFQLGAWTKG